MSRRAETAALTALTMLAFAANSLLTRLALGRHLVDAATFTTVRLGSGAIVLAALTRLRAGSWAPLRGRGWTGPVVLFVYAAPFSLAYLRIGAAVGALVLFGTVQLTMIAWGLASGERPAPRTWLGLALGASGLAWLMLPSATRPDVAGTGLMAVAGVCWGLYSLVGRKADDRVAANAHSFLGAMPFAVVMSALTIRGVRTSAGGLALGIVAGAVTSGLGYAIWYRALGGLTATQAAIVQLSVPVIAALGAVAFLDERLTARLVVSGVVVLGGVALALTGPKR